MAAIDKLWISDYYELEELRRWAIAYYPKLFLWLDIDYTEKTFEGNKLRKARDYKASREAMWNKFASDGTLNSVIAYLISEGCTEKSATKKANALYEDTKATINDICDKIKLSVMNTPFKIDRKLKWICPIKCVRKYLQEQCGMKEHWYYKLFWKGKKYFTY